MNDMNVPDTKINDAVQKVLDDHIASGRELGIQVAAYHHGRLIVDCWAGVTAKGGSQPVDGDTLFNVFSVSKAIADVALHIQIERGLVKLDEPVATYWPEFAQNGKQCVTVAHVLYHRSGVPQMPDSVTPELMCDWNWMVAELAKQSPIFAPGTAGAYQCINQGWMLGEVIRRTDPAYRSYREFVRQEIAEPLGAPDLHHGIPDEVESRIATLDEPDKTEYWTSDSLFRRSIPLSVDLGAGIWERPDVRRATIPSTGGIYNARSEARFWAMLTERGALDGRRILQAETVESFLEPMFFEREPDPVIKLPYIPMGRGGIWLGTDFQPAAPARNARTFIKPGFGHSVNMADMDNHLAAAICHNRLYNAHTIEDCRNTPIFDAIRTALRISF